MILAESRPWERGRLCEPEGRDSRYCGNIYFLAVTWSAILSYSVVGMDAPCRDLTGFGTREPPRRLLVADSLDFPGQFEVALR